MMNTAAARKPNTSLSNTAAPSLNRVLLAGMLAARSEDIHSIDTKSGKLKLLKASSNALSVLEPRIQHKFAEWLQDLKRDDADYAAVGASLSKQSQQEIFNSLGNSLFDEEAAKRRGAIFTPTWIAKRLVSKASGYW